MIPDIERQESLNLLKAGVIVEKAIRFKGDYASVVTSNAGRIKTFEDSLLPSVYDYYLDAAMNEVDAGNCIGADMAARALTSKYVQASYGSLLDHSI